MVPQYFSNQLQPTQFEFLADGWNFCPWRPEECHTPRPSPTSSGKVPCITCGKMMRISRANGYAKKVGISQKASGIIKSHYFWNCILGSGAAIFEHLGLVNIQKVQGAIATGQVWAPLSSRRHLHGHGFSRGEGPTCGWPLGSLSGGPWGAASGPG